jgi:hypothetical protein
MAQAAPSKFSRTSTSRKAADAQPNSIAQDDTLSEPLAVDPPPLSPPAARARFEFEPGRGNEGTKVLMVEWEDDNTTGHIHGAWTVSWEGKSHVLPAEERQEGTIDNTAVQEHRLFFLLPPGISVPATVTLTLDPDGDEKQVVWKANPLPAIFPPGLSDPSIASQASRSKGVLHMLWAKKRLQTLSREIEREASLNVEGVALEMACREKEWIENNFGLSATAHEIPSARRQIFPGDNPRSPTTPMSPGGSRLTEKLKGLKLQTGSSDLRPKAGSREEQFVSPEDEDVAVPSYSAIRDAIPDILTAKPPQPLSSPQRRGTPQHPNSVVRTMQQDSSGSLDGRLSESEGSARDEEDERGLFALPLSPRSPDMTKSPFSFAKSDTMKYVKENRQRVS